LPAAAANGPSGTATAASAPASFAALGRQIGDRRLGRLRLRGADRSRRCGREQASQANDGGSRQGGTYLLRHLVSSNGTGQRMPPGHERRNWCITDVS
jgi:hypothetical protein